jgi:hypothetical protein
MSANRHAIAWREGSQKGEMKCEIWGQHVGSIDGTGTAEQRKATTLLCGGVIGSGLVSWGAYGLRAEMSTRRPATLTVIGRYRLVSLAMWLTLNKASPQRYRASWTKIKTGPLRRDSTAKGERRKETPWLHVSPMPDKRR